MWLFDFMYLFLVSFMTLLHLENCEMYFIVDDTCNTMYNVNKEKLT
jgi:hypothetical protein